MTNLIKVEQVKNDNGLYLPWVTASRIVSQALEQEIEIKGYFTEIDGVTVFPILETHHYNPSPLLGIGLATGGYKTTRRRVMINKAGEIDLDAIRAKHNELKVLIAQEKKEHQMDKDYATQSLALYQEVENLLGDARRKLPIILWTSSPDKVGLDVVANTKTLKVIANLLGEQEARLCLIVSKDEALAVCNILRGK